MQVRERKAVSLETAGDGFGSIADGGRGCAQF